MSYQKKYIKYKSKYIALNIKNNNQIQKELYGGEPKTFNNLFKFDDEKLYKLSEFKKDKITEFNDDRLYEFKKDKITDFNNDKICEFNDDILINKLSELKEQKLNIDNDQVVIEYFFLKQIRKITVDENKNIIFYIKIPSYYNKSIYNNILNLAGINILLYDKYDDNNDTSKIHSIIKKVIFAKHIIDISFSKEVNGVLLTDIIKLYPQININNINTKKIGIMVELFDI